MKARTGILIGAIFGFCLSFITSFFFMFFGQMLAGGFTSLWGELWLYFATVIPFTLTFAVIGYCFTKRVDHSNKRLWVYSAISAFLNTLYSGTIGALFGEFIVRGGSLRTYTENGYTGVNTEGTLYWGVVYAVVLLPLTIPFARLCMQSFLLFFRKLRLIL